MVKETGYGGEKVWERTRSRVKNPNLLALLTSCSNGCPTLFAVLLVQCRRTRATNSGRAFATKATSSAVDSRPNEKRTSEAALSRGRPSASMTCEGSNEPAEHAEPLEAQIPSRSSAASIVMLSAPFTVNATVLWSRSVCEPRNCTPWSLSASRAVIRRVASGASCASGNAGVVTNRSDVAAKPTIAATFSVPARRSFSWLPPKRIGSGCSGERM